MTAPRPKRLTRQDRLKQQMQLRRAETVERHREAARERRQLTPGATITRKPPKAARLDPALEQLLQARAGGRCECCGNALRGRCQRHHRKLRSQGGLNEVANLVVICFGCHNMIHNNRPWSVRHGWIVESHRRPARAPLTLWDERRVRLTTTGGYQEAT